MSVIILRGDAAQLPLADESVDLICTSPPFWGLRDYQDGGESLEGQIGSEETPGEYIAALLRCTREWMRVLKPEGSIFVNLGDAYSKRADGGAARTYRADGAEALQPSRNTTEFAPRKSLLGMPWRYAIRCVDDLGMILRAEIVWAKANGMPESVSDRVRRSHEQVFHLVKQPRYFTAVDEIREPHQPQSIARTRRNRFAPDLSQSGVGVPNTLDPAGACNPLGKLPGSVWEIPTQPLTVPAHLGTDHYAAFPMELPRRIILGWSPSGVCTECGEGRRPVVAYDEPRRYPGSAVYGSTTYAAEQPGAHRRGGNPGSTLRQIRDSVITGYACACAPFTDHEGSGKTTRRRDYNPGGDDYHAQGTYGRKQAGEYERVGPWREYHFDRWAAAPTRPAVVVDPFGGTGTTSLVADMLGRAGIMIDRSADYCRIARWRTSDPAERARALGVPKPPPVMDGQFSLFDGLEAG